MIPLLLNHPLLDLIDFECLNAAKTTSDCPLRLSAAGACPRQVAVLLAGSPKLPITGKQARIFLDGHKRGDRFEDMLVASNRVQAERQMEVAMPLGITAKQTAALADACAKFWPLDKEGSTVRVGPNGTLEVLGHIDLYLHDSDTLIDFKGAKDFSFRMKQTEGADESYIAQVRAYGAARVLEGHMIPKLAIVYENKDSHELAMAAVPFDEDIAEATVVSFNRLAGNVADALIGHDFAPAEAKYAKDAKEGDTLPWQCSYCPVGPTAGGCAPAGCTVKEIKGRGEKPKFQVVRK